MIKYSLVGYDGSDASRRAFQFAVELARCTGGRVRVVWVLQVSEGGADACALMMADSGTQRAQELLAELATIVPDSALLVDRSEEHTSELQSLMRTSLSVFCLTKKTNLQ